MKKMDRLYLILFALVVLIYMAYQVFGPQPVNWDESYSSSDKIPYGAYILDRELPILFQEGDITRRQIPLYEQLSGIDTLDESSINRIFINSVFDPGPVESSMLFKAVEIGDDLFISAASIGEPLIDSLGIEISYKTNFSPGDTSGSAPGWGQNAINVNFYNPELAAQEGWEFGLQRSAYFTRVDTAASKKLGYGHGEERVNFISVKHGRGTIYIHLLPHAFTNYYLRNPEYANYAFKALSYLPDRETVWDEYYKDGRSRHTSPVSYILSEPALKKAWYLTLAGILLFMIFKGRRLQRPVPVREKPENSTLEFARTIGSLYLEKGSHKDLADKKIRFFRDWCRDRLGVRMDRSEQPPSEKIAARSGVPVEQVNELLGLIREVEVAAKISKEDLKKITSTIDQFYKNSER